MKVFIVDDYPLIISRISELLEEVPAATIIKSSTSFHEATNVLKTYRPDVALLDINLPDKSGIELLQYIKSKFPSTHVVIVTNEGSEYYQNLCLSLGADYFIDKSKDFDNIPAIIKNISCGK